MGFSESGSTKCRRHPNQKQMPGVCSSCLREKLSKLSNTNSSSFNRARTTNLVSHSSSFSSTPPYSSASSTSTAAAAGTGNRHRRNGSEVYVSVGMVLNDGLKKSRSVSCARLSRNRGGNMSERISEVGSKSFGFGVEEEEEIGNVNKKKGGFLKRLINSTSKKTKGALMHSKTMKQRTHIAQN